MVILNKIEEIYISDLDDWILNVNKFANDVNGIISASDRSAPQSMIFELGLTVSPEDKNLQPKRFYINLKDIRRCLNIPRFSPNELISEKMLMFSEKLKSIINRKT